MSTRLSLSKKKVNVKGKKETDWVESVYDGDEDTAASDSSPPQKSIDPYEFDFIDDILISTKAKKKPSKTQNQNEGKKKPAKAPKKKKSNATSTPVLTGHKSGKTHLQQAKSDDKNEFLVTPEVTPILPVESDNKKHSLDDSFNTPTVRIPNIRRSLRKRSLHLEDSHLSAITSIKSFDSQTDSGIVVSPPLKIMKSTNLSHSNPSQNKDPIISSKESKKSSGYKKDTNLKIKRKRKVLVHKSENEVLTNAKGYPISFGFDSPVMTLSTSDEHIPNRKVKKTGRILSKHSYRSKSSSSSSCISPVKSTSECIDQENDFNFRHTKSPTLFSDDFFSDDAAEPVPKVNKISSKSYTSMKGKTQLSKKQISKMDSWTNEYNSHFEDIAKFDLFIE